LHQRVRDSRAKYPAPPQENNDCTNSPQSAATCGEPPPISLSESESLSESANARAREPAEKKISSSEFGWVKLTDKQYQRLMDEFGKDVLTRYITIVDEYVQSNGNKNKYSDWNLVIRKAIRDKWGSNKVLGGDTNGRGRERSEYGGEDDPYKNITSTKF
jgi:hypothetical protein